MSQNSSVQPFEVGLPVAQPIFKPKSTIVRVAQSALVWTTIVFIGVITFSVKLRTQKTAVSVLNVFVLAACGYFLVRFIVARWKPLIHEASVALTLAKKHLNSHNWWDEIDDGIYLGGIPLENYGHREAIEKVIGDDGAILSMVENFEFETIGFASEPVKGKQWSKGIQWKIIETPDNEAVSAHKIKEAITQLETWRSEGKKVYLHCKAGKGRSATIAICNLIEKKRLGIQDAIDTLRRKRPQMKLNAPQMKAIEEFYSNLQAKGTEKPPVSNGNKRGSPRTSNIKTLRDL